MGVLYDQRKEESKVKDIIRNRFVDCSDSESFCFSLTCPECGKVWKSTPIRFSKSGEKPPTESKKAIFKILYEREHKQALEKAAAEAMNFFNICPNCKKAVCDDCFLLCDDLDMCRSCADVFQETGEPSSFAGWMVG